MTKIASDIMTDPHIYPVRIYYDATDAGGIVYHANYLVFAEQARTEFLRAAGFDHNTMLKEYNLLFVIRHIDIEYFAPAKLDDKLEIHTVTESCGRTSVNMKQIFYRDGKKLTEIKIVVVAINSEGRPIALPQVLRKVFEE